MLHRKPSLAFRTNFRLEWLYASSNKLTGPIHLSACRQQLNWAYPLLQPVHGENPYNLTNCPTLNRSRIDQNNLRGRIPFRFGNLKNFTYVDLSRNNLTEQLPLNLCNTPRLEHLNISYNLLQVCLPRNIWATPIVYKFIRQDFFL
jgi:hypothetical protein